eukprot:1894569-Alexandrium_andersonii.AAC.1
MSAPGPPHLRYAKPSRRNRIWQELAMADARNQLNSPLGPRTCRAPAGASARRAPPASRSTACAESGG